MNLVVEGWGATRRRLCVLTVLFATAASSLMQTFLTVSLPTATAELDAVAWYGWVTGIYLAAAIVFIPPWAILSDRIGPRTVHVVGMTIWASGTWAVSLSESITWLLGSTGTAAENAGGAGRGRPDHAAGRHRVRRVHLPAIAAAIPISPRPGPHRSSS